MIARSDGNRLAFLVHEVRSPVAALSAIAEALADEELDEGTRRELAGLALAACRGIERVVGDAAVGSVRLEEVDVGRLVKESVAAAVLSGASVTPVISSDLPRIDADPLRLRQALDNLVANAVTHSTTRGQVVVSARVGEGEILLSVSDKGGGIPIEEQERIFEPGVRLDVGPPGSGIGLAVARAIAEAHGGTLTVESAPGEGATFTLVLPLPKR